MPTLPPPSLPIHSNASTTKSADVAENKATSPEAQTKTPIDSQAKLPDALKPYADKLNPVMQRFQNDVQAALAEPSALDLAKGVPLSNQRELSPAQRQAIETAASELLKGIEGALAKAPEDIARAWQKNSPESFYPTVALAALGLAGWSYQEGSEVLTKLGIKPELSHSVLDGKLKATAEVAWGEKFEDFRLTSGKLEGKHSIGDHSVDASLELGERAKPASANANYSFKNEHGSASLGARHDFHNATTGLSGAFEARRGEMSLGALSVKSASLRGSMMAERSADGETTLKSGSLGARAEITDLHLLDSELRWGEAGKLKSLHTSFETNAKDGTVSLGIDHDYERGTTVLSAKGDMKLSPELKLGLQGKYDLGSSEYDMGANASLTPADGVTLKASVDYQDRDVDTFRGTLSGHMQVNDDLELGLDLSHDSQGESRVGFGFKLKF